MKTLFDFAVAGMKAQAEVDKLCEKPPKFDGETARIRDLRKEDFGHYTVICKRREGGLYEYLVYPKDGLV